MVQEITLKIETVRPSVTEGRYVSSPVLFIKDNASFQANGRTGPLAVFFKKAIFQI